MTKNITLVLALALVGCGDQPAEKAQSFNQIEVLYTQCSEDGDGLVGLEFDDIHVIGISHEYNESQVESAAPGREITQLTATSAWARSPEGDLYVNKCDESWTGYHEGAQIQVTYMYL
jgi:hypothetical protein